MQQRLVPARRPRDWTIEAQRLNRAGNRHRQNRHDSRFVQNLESLESWLEEVRRIQQEGMQQSIHEPPRTLKWWER